MLLALRGGVGYSIDHAIIFETYIIRRLSSLYQYLWRGGQAERQLGERDTLPCRIGPKHLPESRPVVNLEADVGGLVSRLPNANAECSLGPRRRWQVRHDPSEEARLAGAGEEPQGTVLRRRAVADSEVPHQGATTPLFDHKATIITFRAHGLRFFTINVNYFDSSKRDMESHLRRVNKLKSMLQYVMFNYYLLMIKMNRIYKLKNNFIM